MPLKALIFDVDGTIAETEEAHRAAFNVAFAEFGLPWHWDRVKYRELLKVGGSVERMRHFMTTEAPELRDRFAAIIDDLFAFKTAEYGRRVRGGDVVLRPGIRRILDDARREGVRIAAATTTGRTNIETLLISTIGADMLAAFEVLATGDTVKNKKPDPELYLNALAGLGLAAKDCLAIEDSEIGLTAARRAGIATLVAPSSYTTGEPTGGAIAVVDHLGDPGDPCRPLYGERPSGDFVTLDDMRRWLANA